MVVGIIDHQTGTRDIRADPPARARAGDRSKVVAVVASASMAGVPLVFGFVAKEEAYASIADGGFALHGLTLAGLVLGSVLTFAYSGTVRSGAPSWPRASPIPITSSDRTRRPPRRRGSWRRRRSSPAGCSCSDWCPASVDRFLTAAAQSLDPEVHAVHLALWHGVNLPLGLSALTLRRRPRCSFAARHPLAKVLAVGARVPCGGRRTWPSCGR